MGATTSRRAGQSERPRVHARHHDADATREHAEMTPKRRPPSARRPTTRVRRTPTRSTSMAPTRERLMDVAMRLFATNGFAGTTVGDIEHEAGLTRRGGGFYRHFRSKTEILTAGIDAHIEQANQS